MNFQTYDNSRQNFQGCEEALIISLSNPSLVKQIGDVLNNSTNGDLTMLTNYSKFLCQLNQTILSNTSTTHNSTKSCDSADNIAMAQKNLEVSREVSQPTKRVLYPEVKMLLKIQKIRPAMGLFKKKVKDAKKQKAKSSSGKVSKSGSCSSKNKNSLIISIPLNLSENDRQIASVQNNSLLSNNGILDQSFKSMFRQ